VEQLLDDESTSMDMAAALLKLLMQREFGAQEQQDALTQDPNWRERHSDKVAERVYGRQSKVAGKRAQGGKAGGRTSMVRLFFNVGNKMHVAPRDLVGAIAGESGIPGRSIGAIEIHDRFCFVEVPEHLAEDVITVMNGSQIRGFRVAVEKASPKS
jgi:ATP-dependent RNA helicase DeaD